MRHGSMIDDIDGSDFQIITIPEDLSYSLSDIKDNAGRTFRDLETFAEEVCDSLSYQEVPPWDLDEHESEVWGKRDEILRMLGPVPACISAIKLVESIDFAFDQVETLGLWKRDNGTILIARSQLRSMESLARTFLHERAHASSGRPDVDRGFELELTDYIGLLAAEQLKRQEAFSVADETSASNDINPKSAAERRDVPNFFRRLFGGK